MRLASKSWATEIESSCRVRKPNALKLLQVAHGSKLQGTGIISPTACPSYREVPTSPLYSNDTIEAHGK